MRQPVFALHAASVHFGHPARAVRALSEVSLQIHAGERVALVGANGCGKSTLLRLLHGLLPSTAGRFEPDPALRQAMLFQKPHLMRLSVQANVALGLWLQGTAWGQAKALALAALAKVGLIDLAQRNARQLSGGQQQRVAMARAWALQPQVLLLDEPTASLDPTTTDRVVALLQSIKAEGVAMLAIFHHPELVDRLADRVVTLTPPVSAAELLEPIAS
ncbi:ATP-binding cassette domain-containing protein [Rhodoferax sp.]|uniref:ATP-binding cassette domain-containing protein n=1 Tax=Rhodoferax sp. TaxID=50421 RepID=UPI0035218B2F